MQGASENLQDAPFWFVLNHVGTTSSDSAANAVNRYNAYNGSRLELFAPTYVVREEKNGQIKMRTANLTFHYVFVRGSFPEIKSLCGQNNGFSFLIDRSSSDRYATVTDREMSNFKNIARAYKNCLPYYPLDEINLEEGDLVEVVNGDFPGLIGTYMPKPRSNGGNIVLNVYNNVGTVVFNVKASDVRVLRFSAQSTRANDQIDAFIPNLLEALQYFDADRPLPDRLIARLSMFCNRMAVADVNNRKLNAKLQALLFGGNFILGNTADAEKAREHYDRLKSAVTNEWTRALVDLIFAVIDNDRELLRQAKERVAALVPNSKARQMIAREYAHYNP